MIKVRALRWEDYPGSSRSNVITGVLRKGRQEREKRRHADGRREREGGEKKKEEEKEKKKKTTTGNCFSPRAAGRNQPCGHPD